MVLIVTRTTGAKVGINLLQILTITPNTANTECDIRVGGVTIQNVIGSVEQLRDTFNSFEKDCAVYRTVYSNRITNR